MFQSILLSLAIGFTTSFPPQPSLPQEITTFICNIVSEKVICKSDEKFDPGDTDRPKKISVERGGLLTHIVLVAIKITMEAPGEIKPSEITIILNKYLVYSISALDAKICIALSGSKDEATVCLINNFKHSISI